MHCRSTETRKWRDDLKISTSASMHQHRHWHHYRHQYFRYFVFALRAYISFSFLKEIGRFTFLTVLQYSVSVYFTGNSYCSTTSYSSIQRLPLVLQKEGLNVPIHLCFGKMAASKLLGMFPIKHLWWSPFRYTCWPSWEFFVPVSIKRKHTTDITSGISKNFKIVQEWMV